MQMRTDRVGLLLDQLTGSAEFARERLDGMDDPEFLWEPVADMWSIRPAGEAVTPDAYGPGEHVLDTDRSLDPFAPGPPGTIAWRIGHLVSAFAGRYEWTFGARQIDPDEAVAFTPRAEEMTARLWREIDRWVEGVEALSDHDLDQVGFGQYPQGLDPQLPFIAIVWWMNRETIHHLAEAALLRDLYAREDQLRPAR